jgi:hypothetical protein
MGSGSTQLRLVLVTFKVITQKLSKNNHVQ